jgi:hypothetical protein
MVQELLLGYISVRHILAWHPYIKKVENETEMTASNGRYKENV